nr:MULTISPECIES: agmatine deiminase family protein [Aeromonas]
MFSRRHVLKQLVALGAIAGFGSLPGARAAFAAGEPGAAACYHMPEESSPQALVWVAFGATSEIWGRHYKEVQATIGRLVQAMVPHTRVNVLCHEDDEALARQLCGERNTHFVHAEMDDIWLRDTGGVFVQDEQGGLGLVDFNFNGWGDKQEHSHDARVAALVGRQTEAYYLQSELIGEGSASRWTATAPPS